jgi:UTP--glucose-1-phosphate uridylyltransferase
MKARPTKAIIPVAGYGTRRLPITKAIEKCMLPILNRPLIDYIVEDCKAAGITEIIFVVSGEATQLKSYYAPNNALIQHLEQGGKTAELDELAQIGAGLTFTYVEQPQGIYGTAAPVWAAKEYLGAAESFVVLMGDDFILRHDGRSATAALIDAWQQCTAAHGLLAVEIAREDVCKYGVLQVSEQGLLQSIFEKPSIEDAPSTYINVSKYVFSASILEPLAAYMAQQREGEYMITDIVTLALLTGDDFVVVPAEGVFLDGGTVDGWLAANNYLAEKHQ